MSKDLFSKQSGIYARFRPGYPVALIDYILTFVPDRHAAWDCATGNGQAAVLLTHYFECIQATDISENQLSKAVPHPRIQYTVTSAEQTPFPDNSFELATVAQAYHWFNFEAFEKEVKRVLKPNGVIAIWGYSLVSSGNEKLDTLINKFYKETVGPYWDAERKYVDDQYRTVAFPYEELPAKEFSIEKEWKPDDFIGYLNTWSSVQHFIRTNGYNPVDILKTELQKVWPEEDIISFRFPLFLRLGRVIK